MLDWLFRDAWVYDGTGCLPMRADVGVKDGRIAAIGRRLPDAHRTIEATGLALAPGFIDSHSHGDLVIHREPGAFFKLAQGVTTEIAGSCGLSPGPFSEAFERQGVEIIAPFSAAGLEPGKRRTFAQTLDDLDVPLGVNTLAQLGHASARCAVSGLANRPLTAREMDALLGVVKEAMQAGAGGVSFGLIYPPSAYAQEEELTEVCKAVAEYGGFFTIHMRSEGGRVLESVDEAIRMAERSGCRGVISHHKATGKPNFGKTAETLRRIEEAHRRGAEVYFDQYPYNASATGLNTLLPNAALAAGTAALVAQLSDKAGREAIRAAIARDRHCDEAYLDESLAHVMVSHSPSQPEVSGRMLKDAAAERGVSLCDAAMDLLQSDRMETQAIFFSMCDEDVERVMRHPLGMLGTDGLYLPGGRCHPRAFASFPRFLGRYCRDKALLPLHEGIRKITAMPARVYNLPRKGLLREGMDADLVLFDPGTILDTADYAEFDKRNEGVLGVWQAGKRVVTDGVWDGGRFGRLMRG